MSINLSLVLPCYNEEKNIPFLCEEFLKLPFENYKAELILVNNGSNDDTKKQIESDIVVNVSGPVDLQSLNNEKKLIKIIKNLEGKFDKRGFLTDRNFMLSNKIFMPGTLAYNFNPLRQTIIKAVTNNSRKAINFLLKENNLI